ncbi:MAG: carboxymuconolactone decarboxylase family protein [Patulibacter sp.]
MTTENQTSTTTAHAPRFDVFTALGAPAAGLIRAEQRIELDHTIKELVKLRASQINGCAFCLDMHWTDAKKAGESDIRLAQLSAYAESPYFDARERAALALTDAVTLLADTNVPDDVWAAAAEQFGDEELAHLVMQIATINAWNRLAVTARSLPASWNAA